MSSGFEVNTGRRSRAQLIFTTPLRDCHDSMSRTKSAGSSLGSSCCRNVIFGWIAVTTSGASSSSPSSSVDAARRAVRGQDPRDARVRPDLGAERPRAGLDRCRDRAHPALRHGPRAEVAVADVADRVVRHHVAGPRFVRTRPRADQAVQRHHGLHLIRLEEPIQDVDDRHGHQARHVADRLHVETAEPPDEPELIDEVGGSLRSDGRRCGHEERTEHLGQSPDPRVPCLDRVGVVLGELGELVVVLRGVVVLHDAAPVGERQEVRTGRMHAIAVPLQLQVAKDGVGHQAHHVAERGDLELGRLRPRRHGVGRAAGLVPSLQHDRPRARLREVCRGDQPVVAAADHDRVVLVRGGDAPRYR